MKSALQPSLQPPSPQRAGTGRPMRSPGLGGGLPQKEPDLRWCLLQLVVPQALPPQAQVLPPLDHLVVRLQGPLHLLAGLAPALQALWGAHRASAQGLQAQAVAEGPPLVLIAGESGVRTAMPGWWS